DQLSRRRFRRGRQDDHRRPRRGPVPRHGRRRLHAAQSRLPRRRRPAGDDRRARRRAGDNRHGQADGPPSHADRLDPARSAERVQGDADRRDRAQRLAAGRIRPVAPGDRPHSSARRSRGSARRDGSWRTCRQDRAGGPMNRTELYALAEAYLDALVAKEPSRLSWAPDAMFTENNVRLEPGDGLWNTISARRPDYDLKAADPSSGQVAWFGIVEEHGYPAIMAL